MRNKSAHNCPYLLLYFIEGNLVV